MILVLLTLCLLTACGKKGPVRPLEKPLPAAPEKVALRQQGELFLLAWSLPEKNQDGSPLKDLGGFRIYRMEYDPAADCPECRDTSVLYQVVDLEYLRQARRIGDRLYLWDGDLEAGVGYRYRIVPLTGKGLAGAPATVRRPFLPPPPAPAGLSAEPLDRLVRLRWEAPEAAAQEIAGYNVYRTAPGEPFAVRPQNAEPLADIFFEDFGLENGRPYLYAVRSVTRIGDLTVESAPSATVEATPRAGL